METLLGRPVEDADLLRIVATAAGTPLARLLGAPQTALPEGSHRDGTKQWATFRYVAGDGKSGVVTLFLKRCVWKNRPESVHYRYLAAHGVPLPQLYGALDDGNGLDDPGAEILFIEALGSIGFHKDEESDWRALLSLMARFNACAITADYVPHLHPYEQIGQIAAGHWISGLDARPTDDALAATLRAAGADAAQLPTLVQAARAVYDRVDAHPRGLLHQDFSPDNFGWRGRYAGGNAEMVVFDVCKNASGPRFADVAPYLGTPDWTDATAHFLDASPDADADAATRRESLARHYLREYARFGGASIPLATFQQETTELIGAHRIAALPWLAAEPERVREVFAYLLSVG